MGADPRQTTQRTSSAANALTSELPRYLHAFGPGQRECEIDVSMLPKSRVLNTLRDAHPHVARGTGSRLWIAYRILHETGSLSVMARCCA